MPLALLAILVPQTPALRLEATPRGLVLVHGPRRLLYQPAFGGETLPTARWRGGATLAAAADALVYRPMRGATRVLSLRAALDVWLMDDGLWGGHEKANFLRYQHLNGYELGLTVRDLVPQADGTALGVATVQLLQRPSILDYPQILFRFDPGVEGLIAVRALSGEGLPPVGRTPHRLFRLGARTVLQDRDLTEPSPLGAGGRLVRALPPHAASLGLSARRWLLLRAPAVSRRTLAPHLVYDSRTGRLLRVGPESDAVCVDPLRPYALFDVYRPDLEMESWSVRLTDGKRTRVLGRPQLAWDGLAIDLSSNPVLVWSAETGKLVARLPRPRGE